MDSYQKLLQMVPFLIVPSICEKEESIRRLIRVIFLNFVMIYHTNIIHLCLTTQNIIVMFNVFTCCYIFLVNMIDVSHVFTFRYMLFGEYNIFFMLLHKCLVKIIFFHVFTCCYMLFGEYDRCVACFFRSEQNPKQPELQSLSKARRTQAND